LVAALFVVLAAERLSFGAEEKRAAPAPLRPAGIDGVLVLAGGGRLPDAVLDRFQELAGGGQARLVVLATAGANAAEGSTKERVEYWQAHRLTSVIVLRPRSPQDATDPKTLEQLRQATGTWIEGDRPEWIGADFRGTSLAKELIALLRRGGVVGGTAAGAAVLGQLLITSEGSEPSTAAGLDFLPGTVIDPHFLDSRRPRLLGVLAKNPGLVGLGIDEGTALVVKGRALRVLGTGTVTVCLAAGKERPPRTIELKSGTAADLTALRRAAIARTAPPFPPREAPVPEVAGGSLVIVGGGGMPADVTKKFIELAGGPDAPIVVLPIAGETIPAYPREIAMFQKAGTRHVQALPAHDRQEVEDPKSLELLKNARGIWFGGGRQWRFVDAYMGTKAHELFREVLRRGGVIGGSSAGATIQGNYLCRGSPLGNLEMMCEGYERGLGFLPGVAIDQHFTQRRRFPDMRALMKVYPQLLGIGIDEGTALIVHGHQGEVIGQNQVHFFDRRQPVQEGHPDHVSVKAGGRYDLKDRRVLAPADRP
jgi:cyanophycinase